MQLGQYNVPDDIATVIRRSAIDNLVPEWFAMGIAGAESDWKADACGDTHSNPTVVVGGNTYTAPYCPYKNTYACSWGLLQLNLCGGQGVGFTREQLIDPAMNCSIGMPSLAGGARAADNAKATGRHWVYIACINSGHPGWVPENDSRIDVYWNVCLKLMFNSDGSWAIWPPIGGGGGQSNTLYLLKCELLGIQAASGRSLQYARELIADLYGDSSGMSAESLRTQIKDYD